MLQIGGLVVLFACVFGGFIMSGGQLGVVIEALPHELLTILGAAVAALLIAGSMYSLKKILANGESVRDSCGEFMRRCSSGFAYGYQLS